MILSNIPLQGGHGPKLLSMNPLKYSPLRTPFCVTESQKSPRVPRTGTSGMSRHDFFKCPLILAGKMRKYAEVRHLTRIVAAVRGNSWEICFWTRHDNSPNARESAIMQAVTMLSTHHPGTDLKGSDAGLPKRQQKGSEVGQVSVFEDSCRILESFKSCRGHHV